MIDSVLYCHGSPRNDLDIFTERAPEARSAFMFADSDAEVVVCGHTHVQFDRKVAGEGIVDTGSVGAPGEDEPGAYSLLSLQHRRTEYQDVPEPQQGREKWLDWVESLGVGSGYGF